MYSERRTWSENAFAAYGFLRCMDTKSRGHGQQVQYDPKNV